MHTEKERFRSSLPLFLMIFMLVALLIATLGLWYVHEQKNVILEGYQVEARHHVEGQMNRVHRFYKQGIGMLLALARNRSLNAAVAGNANARREVAEVFRDVMNASDMYDQIRLLDSAGREAVRVERTGDSGIDHAGHRVRVVPSGQLQNKGARYYVRRALALSGGAVYVSPFDLNMEHGKVQRPYKSMIRFATPVVNNNGIRIGVVIINMPGNSLMQRELSETVLEGEHLLINAGSPYWFDRHVNQLHVLEGMNNVVQAHRFPEDWLRVLKEGKGQYATAEGQFTVESMEPRLPSMAPKTLILPRWQIVSFVPAAALNAAISASVPHTLAICAIAIVLLGLIIWLWSQRYIMKRMAMQALRHSEGRLKLAESNAQLGHWDWDIANDDVEWSDGVYSLLGYAPNVAPSFEAFINSIHPDDREVVKASLDDALHGGVQHKINFRIVRGDREIRIIHAIGEVIFGETAPVHMFGTIQDITELKQAEQALDESEMKYRALVHSVKALPWAYDIASDRFTYVGEQIKTLLGIGPEAMSNMEEWAGLIHPDDRKKTVNFCTEEARKGRHHEIEYRMKQADGGWIWIRDVISVTMGADGPVSLTGFMFDITEHKKATQQREALLQTNRLLAQGLIRAREDERSMLARALHDDIGQKLTAIQMQAVAVTGQCSDKNCPAAKRGIRIIQDMATGVIETVRGQLKQLRPPQLDELGLKAALGSLCADWKDHSGVFCCLSVDDAADALDGVVQLSLYRVVQEGLTNVARHAGASRVYVNLKMKGDGIHLTLRDDGCGFDPSVQTEGIGLTGMRERMDLLGGSMRVESAAGKGTRLYFWISRSSSVIK